MSDPATVRVAVARAEQQPALSAIAAECGLHVDFEAELRKSYALLLVAELEQRPIGFLLAWHAADELHLTDLGVTSEARRRGAARALVSELLARGKARGAHVVLLEVRAGNHAALALYERCGFTQVGSRARYYSDTDEDALLLRLELTSGTGDAL